MLDETAPAAPPRLPQQWPSAWPDVYPPVLGRAAFVLAVMVFTTIGLLIAGDPGAQWWAIVLPLLLLVRPLTLPGRVRRRLVRAVEAERVSAGGVRVHSDAEHGSWLAPTSGDTGVALPAGRCQRALRPYAGTEALLVWIPAARGPAAVVLAGGSVVYLRRAPGGVPADALLHER